MAGLQSGGIAGSVFVDLYVSNNFADVTGLAGVDDTRVPIPASWSEDIKTILELCRRAQQESAGPEFSIQFAGVVYRVTHLDSVEVGGTYVLRQSKAQIRKFSSIGIPRHFAEALLDPKAVGLCLICGGFGTGKTSTGASWMVERLSQLGGIGLAIEDPVETVIHGVHGKGRCISINASRHTGGYQEHLIKGLRSGVNFIFLGEIRDPSTAYEALKAGSNGELIVTTFHALGIAEALERLIALAGQHTQSASRLLADSLLGVVWQNLTPERKGDGTLFNRFEVQTLLVKGENASAVQEKIRSGKISALSHEIEQQAKSGFWSR